MLSKKITDKWRSNYDKQLLLAEKKLVPKIAKYYREEYYKGVDIFIKTDNIDYITLFKYDDFIKVYNDIYNHTCMRFAIWYFRNSDKYEEKKSAKDYTDSWRTAFNFYAGKMAAKNVTLVSGTAKKTLMSVIQKLYRDPDFVTRGADERARILRSKFKQYSKVQAMRLVRTESLRGASYGVEQSALQVYAGRKLKKQWVTFFDKNTRDAHQVANNQTVDFEADFYVGGEYMKRPGEGSDAGNVINCRCSMVPFPENVKLPFQ